MRSTHYLCRCVLLLSAFTVSKAESADSTTVESRTNFVLVGSVYTQAAATQPSVRGYGGSSKFSVRKITRKITRIIHQATDAFQFRAIKWSQISAVASLGNYNIYLNPNIGSLRDQLTPCVNRRPEWFTSPPKWVRYCVLAPLGISQQLDQINSLTDTYLVARDAGFRLNDDMRQQLLMAAVSEARTQVQASTQGVVNSALPGLGIFLSPAVEYGFDRIEDRVDDRISQYYNEGSPGLLATEALLDGNVPIAGSIFDGTCAIQTYISNSISLGGGAKGTYITCPNKDVASEYIAIGGSVTVTGACLILGNVNLRAVGATANLPAHVQTLIGQQVATDAATQVDNTLPAPFVPAMGG